MRVRKINNNTGRPSMDSTALSKQPGVPGQDRDETAVEHMIERVPTGSPQTTVGAVLGDLASATFGSVDAVYVLDGRDRLQGIVPIAELLGAGMQHKLGDIMLDPLTSVRPDDDQELVAAAAVEYGLSDVPVTDHDGRLLGIVPARALLRIQRGEHIEDINRFAGILRDNGHPMVTADRGRLYYALRRLPWLLIGLCGSVLATLVVSAFEAELKKQITVAFFVPAIVYLAGAVGTQSVTISVRALSLGGASRSALASGEPLTGFIIGVVLASLAFPLTALFLGETRLAVAVCLSLIIASTLSTTIGSLLPWLLWKLGRDPALGSGPVATILQDILNLSTYFAIVAWLL